MTTPTPPGGGSNNLLGGASGTLAGANPLQQSIDTLTTSVNNLVTKIGSLNVNGSNGNGAGGGWNNNGGGFPGVNSPVNNRNIGGGGPGGNGNVSTIIPFSRMGIGVAGAGMLAGSFAGYGQQQMPFQLGLNSYASMSMMGMNNAGMGNYAQNASMLGNQPGMNLASSPLDFVSMMQRLSFLGGAPNYMSTGLGRAGFGATAAFGMTNPTLSGAAAANLSQQIYSPMLSMRMRLLGYPTTPRTMGTGFPRAIGNVASSILQGLGYTPGRVSQAQLATTFGMGGKGFESLQYLGLNPQQMAPLIEGFNRLYAKGYTPAGASALFSQAASNNPSIARAAQAKLTQAGVTSVSSDVQKMKNNQSQLTQRDVNVAGGFNAALTASTDSLQRFNQALNSILNRTGLNGPLGALAGGFGVLSGTNHGNFLGGLGGLGLLGLALRGGGAGSLLGGASGAGGAAGGAGLLGSLGGLGLGVAAGAMVNTGLNSTFRTGPAAQVNKIRSLVTGWGLGDWLIHSIMGSNGSMPNTFSSGGRTQPVNIGGGAGSAVQTTSQQSTKGGSRSTHSGISSAAIKAVGAAESQIGVPYVWGGEQPGVGFDCSGLVQWAYKQAGVNLPRVSWDQWNSLKRKRVPLSQVQEGDIVFAAGSDGTATKPGHEGMMINNRQLIQAPFSGENVQIIGFNPHDWIGAARPSGRGTFGIANGTNALMSTGASSLGLSGNRGASMGIGGNYGSINEVDAISGMGSGAGGLGMGGSGLAGMGSSAQSPNSSSSLTGTGNIGGSIKGGSNSIASLKSYAMQLLKARGWGNQFGALNSIIMAESGWRWNAANPSGAYGIPQALPGSKMSVAGSNWRSNGDTQLRWMIDDYIPKVYGSPANAWRFHQANGWYGSGGISNSPGMRVVGDRGPEIQVDTPGGGTLTINNSQTMSMLKAISQPQQTPWKNFTASQYGGKVITPGQPGGSGVKVNVTFGQNSININMNSSTSDTQSTGRSLAQQIVQQIQQEELWSAIGMGTKN